MIQDVDSNLPNFGVVSENPHLIDINMITGGGGGGDWFHVNGVDYNEDLDQIAFSSRFASEIYIIDHSTITAEAASHTGGNSGMGGDILYRWGNPSNYNVAGSQIIPNAVHDVRWITDDGRPNGGFLQVFNNSGVSNNQSAVDGIETPIDPSNPYNYYRTPGQAFGPSSYSTRYACAYSASGQSASDRMSNGNIFVNASGGQGGAGVMYEVDQNGSIIWGPYSADTEKAFRYECEHPGIIALQPYMNSTTITSCFSTSIKETDNDFLSLYPNPTTDLLNISFKNSFEKNFDIIISNNLGQEIYYKRYNSMNTVTQLKINLSNHPQGYYNLSLISKDGKFYSYKIALIK